MVDAGLSLRGLACCPGLCLSYPLRSLFSSIFLCLLLRFMLPVCPEAEEIIVLLIRQRKMTVLERKVEQWVRGKWNQAWGSIISSWTISLYLAGPGNTENGLVLVEDLEEAGSRKRLTMAKLW